MSKEPKRPIVRFDAKIEWVNLSGLKEHPKNPRIDLSAPDNAEKFESLKRSIEEGLFEPIIVSRLSKCCISGNQRLKAFADLGYDQVPVQYNDYKNEEDELRDMIKANNEWGEYDYLILKDITEDMELDDLGLSESDIDSLTNIGEIDDKLEDEKEKGIKESYEVVIECQNEDEQQSVYENLTEQGYTCRLLTL